MERASGYQRSGPPASITGITTLTNTPADTAGALRPVAAASVIKELYGHSGSQIYLMRDANITFVRKIGNIERNYERMLDLRAAAYPLPAIYGKYGDTLDLEYIHGLDMQAYLLTGDVSALADFILDMLNRLSERCYDRDYSDVYWQKLDFVDASSDLPFTRQQLINRLPSRLPASNYHGDFTLENILYSNDAFYLIDAATVEYNSFIFDIAKLRQDLQCKWFLRKTNLMLDVKVQYIQDRVLERFTVAKEDALVILMLLRVYRHTCAGDPDRTFILEAIKNLW